uniref:Replication factor A C-terminal domain-containing protein n=1 Tax=Vitis vinifera TaxID=29760 RepID=F6H4S1_VITVI
MFRRSCKSRALFFIPVFFLPATTRMNDKYGRNCWIMLINFQLLQLNLSKLETSKEGEENLFQQKLKEAIWVPQLFRISVAQHEYMNEKRQRITARAVVPVDFAAESRLLLEEISKMKTSQ